MKNNNWLNNNSKQLFKVLSLINDEKDMANFCRDLMTESEIEALSGRWKVAQLLDSGIPQREVSEKSSVSIATVTRVNQWLNRGMNGYKKALTILRDNSAEQKPHSHTRAD
jgi:TrpR-related protein YerC/YecD